MLSIPDLRYEDACTSTPVCGVDEVGRGPWAGPILAAAVILRMPVEGLRDSKALSAKRREALARRIHQDHLVGVGIVEAAELDAVGLTRANDLAMIRAIAALPETPEHALIDGKRMPRDLPCPATTLIGGDGKSASIAAASIVAKVARDAIMAKHDTTYPGYSWAKNAGYGTREHAAALARLGITPQHRRCFRPIREILVQQQKTES